ncbi:hypothetical protein CTEN210_07385 [Chaetoceros tenuissimus]|uniref:Leucine-rich repeat domain-containing protein n=1 Tax=Chaetoceros tenuissimus TaxID=426638 RepID=A0AAD3CUN2_9STRA|nr:hypothetical protein CTEN210_07385 [Chaetoceros tenuissimus]
MRVQTEEWQRFIPGIRMYKGKKTFFYNGETLVEHRYDIDNYLIHNRKERQTWEVIIVLPGVEVIPSLTFMQCGKLETVIMADTVIRIQDYAFFCCKRLVFVRLSRNLELIRQIAFSDCESLTSIFIPPSCREIVWEAFQDTKLIIFNVPQHTQLHENVFSRTPLIKASTFMLHDESGQYYNTNEANQWVKDMNQGEEFELHRACSSINPLIEIIYGIVRRKGLHSLKEKNEIGMTPSDYLEANPFIENQLIERVMMRRYVLEMMGETV